MIDKIIKTMFPGVIAEYRFSPPRRWRFDFAWPDKMIALEIEGGTWVFGRHNSGQGYENDCIKYSEAAIQGWKVIRATTSMMKDGRGIELLERAMKT